jgi:hypothetical protein
MPSPSVR